MSHGSMDGRRNHFINYGIILLIDTQDPALCISLQVLVPAILVASGFFIVVIWLAIKAQMRKHYTGTEAMVGQETEALTDIADEGNVFTRGEYWSAKSEKPIKKSAKMSCQG